MTFPFSSCFLYFYKKLKMKDTHVRILISPFDTDWKLGDTALIEFDEIKTVEYNKDFRNKEKLFLIKSKNNKSIIHDYWISQDVIERDWRELTKTEKLSLKFGI